MGCDCHNGGCGGSGWWYGLWFCFLFFVFLSVMGCDCHDASCGWWWKWLWLDAINFCGGSFFIILMRCLYDFKWNGKKKKKVFDVGVL